MATIRTATHQDSEAIHQLHLSAFPENENRKVATLAVELLTEKATPETLSLVAETDGRVVGHIAFSPVRMSKEGWIGYILAPLGISPDYQQQHIGSELINYGVEQLSDTDANMLFVYGDPDYYGKFGFTADAAEKYLPPHSLQYPVGWQAVSLSGNDIADSKVTITCVTPLNDPELW